MESNGNGGDDPQRFGRSGQPNPDKNTPLFLRVVNISIPSNTVITDEYGTRRLATLVPADQPTNASNILASNVPSSNANIGNPNLVNNLSNSGSHVPNPTMTNPEFRGNPRMYFRPTNEITPNYPPTRPGYAMNSMDYPTVDSHHFPPHTVAHNSSSHPNNPHNHNAPEAPLGYNGNNTGYPIYAVNPSFVNYENSTGNYDPNAHNGALNNTYNNVAYRVDGNPPTFYMVAPPMTVPSIHPNYAVPSERLPFLGPTINTNVESGYSIPNNPSAYAPPSEPISTNRLIKSNIPDESSHDMTENIITYPDIYRPHNNSFVSGGMPNMGNMANANAMYYIPPNNYFMMSNTNANEVSYSYHNMNARDNHSYSSERVDSTALSNGVVEYGTHASHSHVPEMNSFDPNTYGDGDEFGRR